MIPRWLRRDGVRDLGGKKTYCWHLDDGTTPWGRLSQSSPSPTLVPRRIIPLSLLKQACCVTQVYQNNNTFFTMKISTSTNTINWKVIKSIIILLNHNHPTFTQIIKLDISLIRKLAPQKNYVIKIEHSLRKKLVANLNVRLIFRCGF